MRRGAIFVRHKANGGAVLRGGSSQSLTICTLESGRRPTSRLPDLKVGLDALCSSQEE